jgi:hypothetical protein
VTIYTDDFNRSDTADGAGLGTIPGGPAWAQASGSWRILSNRAQTSTARTSHPVASADFSSTDADMSVGVSAGGGDALYMRVVDASNWLRLRLRTWSVTTSSTTQNYRTEYEWGVFYQVYGSGNLNSGETTGQHSHSTPYSPARYGWGGYSTPPSFPGTANHTHGTYYPDGTYTSSYAQRNHAHNYTNSYPQKTGGTRQVNDGSTTTYNTTTYRQVILDKSVAGTITTLATSPQTTGAITSLRLRGIGSGLSGYYNGGGTAVVTATDTSHAAATDHGIGRGTSDLDGSALDNFTLDNLNAAPFSPAITSPASADPANRTAGLLVEWVFSDPDAGETQSAFALRRTIGADVRYWNVSAGTWDVAEVKNAGATSSVTLAAPVWSESGTETVEISVKNWDSGDTEGPYADDVGVTPTSFIKAYDGSSFGLKPLRSYDGSVFANGILKRWNGSDWVLV